MNIIQNLFNHDKLRINFRLNFHNSTVFIGIFISIYENLEAKKRQYKAIIHIYILASCSYRIALYWIMEAIKKSNMKLKFESQKKSRIKYNFTGFTTFENEWMHNHDKKRWEKKLINCNYGSHEPCRSARAFRRKLKKAPKGVEFILESRWKCYNITGFGEKNYLD